MAEKRKKLSEVAFDALINSQLQLNNAQQQVRLARNDLNKIVALILDGLGLPINTQVNLDPKTKELVYFLEEPKDVIQRLQGKPLEVTKEKSDD